MQRNEECELLEHLAHAHSSQGRFQRTIQLQNEITVIARELGDQTREAKALANLGTAYRSPIFVPAPPAYSPGVPGFPRDPSGSKGRKDRGAQLFARSDPFQDVPYNVIGQ